MASHCESCATTAPLCQCSCTNARFYCRDHILAHFLTHQLPANAPTADGVTKCYACGNTAVALCCCRFPVELLCETHKAKHQVEKECAGMFYPVDKKAVFADPREFERVNSLLVKVPEMKRFVVKSIEQIEQCKAAYSRMCTDICQKTIDVCNINIAALTELQQALIARLDDALKEVRTNVLEKRPSEAGSLAALIADSMASGVCDTVLFEYEFNPPPLIVPQFAIEWFSPFDVQTGKVASQELAVVRPADVCVYTPAKKKWRKVVLSQQITVDQYSAFTFLPNCDLFVCGGSPTIATTNVINLKNGTVTAKENMPVGRSYHSICCYNNCVYVFGGYTNTTVANCEKMAVGAAKWEVLPPLKQAAYCIAVCPYKDKIYLMGGYGMTEIAVFTYATNQFQPITGIAVESGYSVGFVKDNWLYLISPNKTLKYSPDTGKSETIPHSSNSRQSYSPVCVLTDSILYSYSNCIYSVNTLTWESGANIGISV